MIPVFLPYLCVQIYKHTDRLLLFLVSKLPATAEEGNRSHPGSLFFWPAPYSPVTQRVHPSACHLKVFLVNTSMNKLRWNPLRFQGFLLLFLRPQEGALLGMGWGVVLGWGKGMDVTAPMLHDLLSKIRG